jgi:hypothetical protein
LSESSARPCLVTVLVFFSITYHITALVFYVT